MKDSIAEKEVEIFEIVSNRNGLIVNASLSPMPVSLEKGNGSYSVSVKTISSRKSRSTTILLALFFGFLGIHRFYLRQFWWGFFSLLFCWTFLPWLISVFDVFYFLFKTNRRFDAKYNDDTDWQCRSCGVKMNFWNTPVWRNGRLKDGGHVCHNCYGRFLKQDKSLKTRLDKRYDTFLFRKLLSGDEQSTLPSPGSDIYRPTAFQNSKALRSLHAGIIHSVRKKNNLTEEIKTIEKEQVRIEKGLKARFNVFRRNGKSETPDQRVVELKRNIEIKTQQLQEIHTPLHFIGDDSQFTQWGNLLESFSAVTDHSQCYVLLSDEGIARAGGGLKKGVKQVCGIIAIPEFLAVNVRAIALRNSNDDLWYFFPGFLLQQDYTGGITLVDFREIEVDYREVKQAAKGENKRTDHSDLVVIELIIQDNDSERFLIIDPDTGIPFAKKLKAFVKGWQQEDEMNIEPSNSSKTLKKGENEITMNDIDAELNSLIGLKAVKNEVRSLQNFIKVQAARHREGLAQSQLSYHLVFTGNPGTGKTTVARIIAKMYKAMGLLEKGHLVETDRSGLVAEYLGQTAVKVHKIVDQAIDGILFVDEAYALVGNKNDDFGREAVATLLKRMEDDRDRLVVILAGYPDDMDAFLETNPGLRSRFNRFIQFPDYGPADLLAIFKVLCSKAEYQLNQAAEEKLKQRINTVWEARSKSFGNGRFVRNLFEKAVEAQANRIAAGDNLSREQLTTLVEIDIP